MKIISILTAASLLVAIPASVSASDNVTFDYCLNATVFGDSIDPPMCGNFVSLVEATGDKVCEWVIIPSGGTRCVTDRPAPPSPK